MERGEKEVDVMTVNKKKGSKERRLKHTQWRKGKQRRRRR